MNYLKEKYLQVKAWVYWWITYYYVANEDITITILRELQRNDLFVKKFTIPRKWNRDFFKTFNTKREITENQLVSFLDKCFGGNELTKFFANSKKESDEILAKKSIEPWEDASVNTQKFFITYFDEDNKNELVVICEHEGIFFSEKDLKDWKYFASEKSGWKEQYTKKMFLDWFELRK